MGPKMRCKNRMVCHKLFLSSASFFYVYCFSERTDYLDDGEQFQLLERTRVLEEDPDSLSFYNASKFAKKKSRTGQSRKPLATNLGQSGRM